MHVAAPCFDNRNPNKVYSLIGGFCSSSVNFHAKDGSGYEFIGDMVLKIDKINPHCCISKHFSFLKVEAI
jgi:aminopeptidase N